MKRYVREFANDMIKLCNEAMKVPSNETTTQEKREAHILDTIERIKTCLSAYEHGRLTEIEAMRLIAKFSYGYI